MIRLPRTLAALAAASLLLAGCASGDPMAAPTATTPASGGATVKVGSANFPESEIIAEIYAKALEENGFTVERRMQIGARDVYVAAVKDGSIDLVPEYTGNLLQYFDKEATAKTSAEVAAALAAAAPEGLKVLAPAPAEDKDSYNVTKAFSDEHGITSLADLTKFPGTLRVGGNPELAQRPYGPQGLTSVYGVPADRITFTAISDGGGPLTVKALADGDVDVADIYSTTPAITENGFVTLDDPENLIVAQNVVPLLSTRITDAKVATVLDAVSAQLTTADLLALNGRNSGDEKASPADLAEDWLEEKDLID